MLPCKSQQPMLYRRVCMKGCVRQALLACCARFGLLQKAARKKDEHRESKEPPVEQQLKNEPQREGTPGREFTPQQKVIPMPSEADAPCLPNCQGIL